MCFLRDHPAEYAMATLLESLAAVPEWIVGVGLDSRRARQPPVKFAKVFAARPGQRANQLTMHCDVVRRNSVEHIRQCVTSSASTASDHGVNCLDSAELQTEIRARASA